jgi:hypothetical protein
MSLLDRSSETGYDWDTPIDYGENNMGELGDEYGAGDGSGDGDGFGWEDGSGDGDGFGWEDGSGDGDGFGWEDGSGNGLARGVGWGECLVYAGQLDGSGKG